MIQCKFTRSNGPNSRRTRKQQSIFFVWFIKSKARNVLNTIEKHIVYTNFSKNALGDCSKAPFAIQAMGKCLAVSFTNPVSSTSQFVRTSITTKLFSLVFIYNCIKTNIFEGHKSYQRPKLFCQYIPIQPKFTFHVQYIP